MFNKNINNNNILFFKFKISSFFVRKISQTMMRSNNSLTQALQGFAFVIVGIWVSTPSKTPLPIFLTNPSFLKFANCLSPPHFIESTLYIDFFVMVNSPLKVVFFSESQKHYSLSSSTPFYLLKITTFLVKISQFEF